MHLMRGVQEAAFKRESLGYISVLTSQVLGRDAEIVGIRDDVARARTGAGFGGRLGRKGQPPMAGDEVFAGHAGGIDFGASAGCVQALQQRLRCGSAKMLEIVVVKAG